MNHPERIVKRLSDIVVACNRLALYTHALSQDQFGLDVLVQDGVIRQLEVIGEAANYIRREDDSFLETNGLDELLLAIAMRNRLIHDYRGVSVRMLWSTATSEASSLRLRIIATLQSFGYKGDLDSLHF